MAITRILFASDLHGAEGPFRKFIASAIQYKVDVALTSELTGKFTVPVVKKADGTLHFMFREEIFKAKNEEETKQQETRAANKGMYFYYTTDEEYADLQNSPEKVKEIFKTLIKERIASWVKLAEEKLKGKVQLCMMMPCNDDELYIDDVISKSSDWVVNPEGKVLQINNKYEFFATGYSNITPWKCARDIPEEELGKKLDDLASKIKNWETAIAHTHVPPYNTKIDSAPMLTEDFKVVYKGGGAVMTSVGSTAVRAMLEKYQPLLSLHGHIHESKGVDRIGRTLAINTGSEYHKGFMSGVLLNLEENRVKGHMFLYT